MGWELVMQVFKQRAKHKAASLYPEQRRVPGDGRSKWEQMACCWAPQGLPHHNRHASAHHGLILVLC